MMFQRKDGRIHRPGKTRLARRALAALFIIIGILGCILPIIPGIPFFVAAARLLGPRDRLVRRVSVAGHRGLRGLRASRLRVLRYAGTRLVPHWRLLNRLMLGAS